jgi:DNA-binding transcriptional ArsR family regulator
LKSHDDHRRRCPLSYLLSCAIAAGGVEAGANDDLVGVRARRTPVSRPLYQLKAEFFKTLGHPVRIRVLELLSIREHAVSELLGEIEIEPANLSQQLAVLRRAGLVKTRREGSAVHYSLTGPHVSELLAVARTILTGVLSGQVELLDDLRSS